MHQGLEAPWCTKTSYRHRRLQHRSGRTHRQHETEVDSEAGMLSGVSRKRSIRSSPCWFTEFCKSQCLSHFAAPFIVVRAETSVAESCKCLQKPRMRGYWRHNTYVEFRNADDRTTTGLSADYRSPAAPERLQRTSQQRRPEQPFTLGNSR